jgi:hypothetical protein
MFSAFTIVVIGCMGFLPLVSLFTGWGLDCPPPKLTRVRQFGLFRISLSRLFGYPATSLSDCPERETGSQRSRIDPVSKGSIWVLRPCEEQRSMTPGCLLTHWLQQIQLLVERSARSRTPGSTILASHSAR